MDEANSEAKEDFSWLAQPLTGWQAAIFWATCAVSFVGLVVALFNLPMISGNVPA